MTQPSNVVLEMGIVDMEPWCATAAEPSICYPPPSCGPFMARFGCIEAIQGDHCIPDEVVNRRKRLI
jgi:hypothetical protein